MTLLERMGAHAALHAELVDPEQMQWAADLREAAQHIRLLREALADAIVCVQDWSAYVAPYYLEKHDLDGDVKRLRAALEKTK